MPIKSLVDNQQLRSEFSIGRDVEFSFCSDGCLLKDINGNSRVVQTGQTDVTALTAILDENRLLVPIAGASRAPMHVLGAQSGQKSPRANWEKLLGAKHSALMSVYRVCDCMAEVQILDGQEFVDAATTPPWKKVRGIVGKSTNPALINMPVPFDQWRTWMAELAQGLDELEKIGLAHGDPYPFNAICINPGAAWVDFGHLTDDPAQPLKDAWAFVLFTVLHTLSRSAAYSPAFIKDLAAGLAHADYPGRFERIREVLLKPYCDLLPLDDVRTPEFIFIRVVAEQSHSMFGKPDVLELLLKASVQYFSAFLHHIQRGNANFKAFHLERQRHRFWEEEMLRLMVPKAEHLSQLDGLRTSQQEFVVQKDEQIVSLYRIVAEHEERIAGLKQLLVERDGQIAGLNEVIAARDGQITRLNSEVAEHEERIACLKQLLVERDEQIAEFNKAIATRDGQIASLNQTLLVRDNQLVRLHQETDSLFMRLEQLLQSRSWQLTRPLRAAVRTVRHGHPLVDGNRAIYEFAARIGRKFPFPLWMKARVRAALIEKMYPTAQPAPSNRLMPDHKQPDVSGQLDIPRTHMRPECCGLIEGLVSVVLPVYNQANLITESIESVLKQTYQSFELIIINDGSNDGVEMILGRYLNHPKVRCFTQSNQRLPKALSNGFDHARGEFWTWTSADNIMEPRMLEMLVAKLRDEPELGMTFADYYAIDDRGHILQDKTWRAHNRPNPSSGEIRLPHTTGALNTVQDNFIGPCFMYRGWVGRCLGDYDPQLGIEDYDYWMRVNAFFPIRHLGDDSLLYRYRVHDNTLSAQAHEHRILEKAQRLMAYEQERARYYDSTMAYRADSSGLVWLQANDVADNAIYPFEAEAGNDSVAVIGSETAEKSLSSLLNSEQPTAVIVNRCDTSYHKLHRLFSSGHCIVLAEDREGAQRVRLLSSSCPVIDADSKMAAVAMRAFVKNLLFVRKTRSADELERKSPYPILDSRTLHVVLQVDSFTQGGMENVVIDLGLSLQTNGYRVTIMNFGKSGDASAKAISSGLRVEPLTSDINDEAYCSWLLEHKVDLVNAHYSIRGAAACRDAGIPFIQTVHNSYVWLDPTQVERYREADRYTESYLCVSMTAARYADIVLGLDVGKMRVVPNGIDPNAIDVANFATNRSSLRSAWGVGDQVPIFLNVASIMATKAQLPLVKAFAHVAGKIPDARLVLLGAVMEASYQAAIEQTVNELGLQNNVLFVGYDRGVSRYYHASDIFVLPSYWEGWSLSLGEAMANGLACVITDVGSAYEFEGFCNVEVVDPPFGDIAELNYRNLGNFVYGEDEPFEIRLADAMIKTAKIQRAPVNLSLAEQIDRDRAYQIYSETFADKIKERN